MQNPSYEFYYRLLYLPVRFLAEMLGWAPSSLSTMYSIYQRAEKTSISPLLYNHQFSFQVPADGFYNYSLYFSRTAPPSPKGQRQKKNNPKLPKMQWCLSMQKKRSLHAMQENLGDEQKRTVYPRIMSCPPSLISVWRLEIPIWLAQRSNFF